MNGGEGWWNEWGRFEWVMLGGAKMEELRLERGGGGGSVNTVTIHVTGSSGTQHSNFKRTSSTFLGFL